jgi:hypothetical protein
MGKSMSAIHRRRPKQRACFPPLAETGISPLAVPQGAGPRAAFTLVASAELLTSHQKRQRSWVSQRRLRGRAQRAQPVERSLQNIGGGHAIDDLGALST